MAQINTPASIPIQGYSSSAPMKSQLCSKGFSCLTMRIALVALAFFLVAALIWLAKKNFFLASNSNPPRSFPPVPVKDSSPPLHNKVMFQNEVGERLKLEKQPDGRNILKLDGRPVYLNLPKHLKYSEGLLALTRSFRATIEDGVICLTNALKYELYVYPAISENANAQAHLFRLPKVSSDYLRFLKPSFPPIATLKPVSIRLSPILINRHPIPPSFSAEDLTRDSV